MLLELLGLRTFSFILNRSLLSDLFLLLVKNQDLYTSANAVEDSFELFAPKVELNPALKVLSVIIVLKLLNDFGDNICFILIS